MHTLKLGEDNLEVQTEDLADQAAGCCLAKLGDTSVLCTCQTGEPRTNLGFFPLTCDYEERYYAAGKILGSRFIRREGRPSSRAVLITRLIDRAIRPLFPKELKSDTQVIATCLSWDEDNDPAVIGLNGASTALTISNIPWNGPIGAVRIGKENSKFVLNPNYQQRDENGFDLVLAGVKQDNDILINMIEFEGDEVQEDEILKACDFAKPYIKQIIEFQQDLQKKIGRVKMTIAAKERNSELEKQIGKILKNKLAKSMFIKQKQERNNAMEELKQEVLALADEENAGQAMNIFEQEQEKLFKESVIKKDQRPDGRKLDQIRDIKAQIKFLARNHGSAIFTRGETRALSILTLGAPGDQQLLEGMEISGKKRFMHHYNFPPYSVGEVRPLRFTNRREIGHGMLAEKALLPLIPKFEDFPYTIRVVSEMLASNGSTSMASVSSACLALMDGGVPIERPAAGIAIGLVKSQDKEFKLLTDIQGPEDHYGEMDFKVAGTEKGITAMQVDVKTNGLTKEIIDQALSRAKKARLEILAIQNKTISEPRKELSKFAPRVYTLSINPEKIGAVIGSGGKIINEIIDECEVSIDIEESGQVFITSESETGAKKAIEWIKNLAREVKVGEIFQGKVKRILNFGAMVEIFPGQTGMVHISEFVQARIDRIEDVVKINEIIPVKVINIDDQGRVNLSAEQAGFKPKKNLVSKQRSSHYGQTR